MRDKLQGYVKDHLGDADGVLVVDETGFLKKGTHSVGVARQYSGTAGKVENCQIGVFLTYASAKGFTLIDRRLYLPKAWSEDRARCRQAGVPDCAPGFERCLLVRQNLKGERERQAFLCYYPSGTPLKELVRVAGIRWTVEQSFQEAKGEVGLDHYEVRSYNGWYRHITLAMAAHALLTAIKATAACDALLKGALEPPKGDPMAGFKKGRHLRSRSQNPSSAG